MVLILRSLEVNLHKINDYYVWNIMKCVLEHLQNVSSSYIVLMKCLRL